MEKSKTFNYFGYASNLKKSLLEQRIGDRILDAATGRLADYGFRFNRLNPDKSARANIISSQSEDVFGVVYTVPVKYQETLLATEPGYELITVSVETLDGSIDAFTFISNDNHENIFPSNEYLKTILEGADEHRLPKEYIEFIRSLAKRS